MSVVVQGDPQVSDNGDGTRTASWPLLQASDYTWENVSLAGGAAELAESSFDSLHTADLDFQAGTYGPETTVAGGSVTLTGNETDLVSDGPFDTGIGWSFGGSPNGSVGAFWDVPGAGAFEHSFSANDSQYDSMDSGCILFGWGTTGNASQSWCTQDASNFVEGGASTNVTWSAASQSEVVGMLRNDVSPLNLSAYGMLAVWLDTNYTGPNLRGSLRLVDGGGIDWTSEGKAVTSGWKTYSYSLEPFVLAGGSLDSVDFIQFNFTGVVGTTAVFVDDVRFVEVDRFNETAGISQIVAKSFPTPPTQTQVLLQFEYEILRVDNLTAGLLSARIDSSVVWQHDALAPAARSTVYVDVSSVMSSPASYDLAFKAQVGANTTGNAGFLLRIDNVSLVAPRRVNALYLSPPVNATSEAMWGRMFWNATVPPETTLEMSTRSGPVEDPSDPSWSGWSPVPAAGNAVQSPPAAYLQYAAYLNTTNASVGPSLEDVSVEYSQRSAVGWIQTMPFTPASPLIGWREFVGVATLPPGTSAAYYYWNGTASSWSEIVSGENLSYVQSPSMQLRAVVATSDTTTTPTLRFLNLTYEALGPLASISLSPGSWAGPVGGAVTFQATGHDQYGRVVPFDAVWETDDPLGTVVNGTYTAGQGGAWSVWSNDSAGSVGSSVTVWVAPGPEIQGTIAAVAIQEDSVAWSADLSGHAAPQADANDTLENLRWVIEGGRDDLYTITGPGDFGAHGLLVTPVENAFGSSQVTFRLEDRDDLSSVQAVWINVTPVNDPPLFSGAPDISVQAGEPYTFDYSPYVTDADDSDGNLTLTTDDPARAVAAGLSVTYTYPASDVGRSIPVELVVSDGELQSHDLIMVDVTDNAPPVLLQPLPDVEVQRGETLSGAFDLDDYFSDPELGPLLMSAHGSYTHLAISIFEEPHKVDFTSLGDWTGVEEVIFRAADQEGATAEDSIQVTIVGANVPPAMALPPVLRVAHDVPYAFDLAPHITDPDTPMSQLTATADVANVTVSGLRLEILMSGWNGEEYSIPVHVNVTDGGGWVLGTLEVLVGDSLPPSVVMPLPDVSFNEDESYQSEDALSGFFGDVGLDPTFQFFGMDKVSVSTDALGRLNLTAEKDWYGSEAITVRAIKSESQALVEDTFWAVVLPVNDPPTVDPLPPQELIPGEATFLDLSGYVSDVDDPVSALIVQTSSTNIRVVGQTLVLEYSEGGTAEDVDVTVYDGEYVATTALEVRVAATAPPVILWADLIWVWLPLLIAAAAGVAYIAYTKTMKPYALEDLFIITRGGKLVLHHTTRLRADMDEDVLAGMLTAVQEFVRDAFQEEAEHLKRFEFGDKVVLIERGEYVSMAAFYRGDEPEGAADGMWDFVQDLEERYASILPHWTGEPASLPGLPEMASTFAGQRRYRREDWSR